MKILKRIGLYLGGGVALYLIVGYLLHLVIFPEPEVDVSNFFQPGESFYSKSEKLRQTVIKQESGKVYCKVELEAHAPGPPLHIHTGFDELFEVHSGRLTIRVEEKTLSINPGEKYFVARGTPHQPFNETDSSVVAIMDEFAFPEDFAVYLTQVYGYIDESPENMRPPKVILQMAMFNQHFDSYLGDGPPVVIQKLQNFLLVPIARLLGYQSFYEKYRT